MILLTILGALALSAADAGAPTQAAIDATDKRHWMWIADPTIGPRAGPPITLRRIWVKDVQPAKLDPAEAGKHPKVWRYVTETKVGPRSGAPTVRKVLVDQ